jgi:hypothetical protein
MFAHPLDGDLSLLYIGISPVREGSRQTIRSRVIGNHLKGNVGSSTFRFTLAALIDALALRPFMRRTKVALDAADNAPVDREHDGMRPVIRGDPIGGDGPRGATSRFHNPAHAAE